MAEGPGQPIRHPSRSPRAISSLINSPATIVLPAPGSSASKETQGLGRKHRLVGGHDLVRKRIHDRRVDCQHGVEQVSQPDPLRLGHEPEHCPVAVEASRSSGGHDLQPGFVVAVEQLVADGPGHHLVRQLKQPVAKVADPVWRRRDRPRTLNVHGDGQETDGNDRDPRYG